MNRIRRHVLLWGSLLGLLAGCGQIPGENDSIAGTIRAPTGGDVAGTQVFACYENENNCDPLGEVRIAESGAAADYQTGGLGRGRYGVYAFKDVNQDGNMSGNGDFFGYYNPVAGQSSLVTPPAEHIDIQMTTLTGASEIPRAIHELQLTTP